METSACVILYNIMNIYDSSDVVINDEMIRYDTFTNIYKEVVNLVFDLSRLQQVLKGS